jgi:ABC transporter substrate binding protein (PQQ-dependent alcohol dehydrogenase system)
MGPLCRSLRAALIAALWAVGAASAGSATIDIVYVELEGDSRYDETRLLAPVPGGARGRPYASAEVALRESRFAGKALGVEFRLQRAAGPDAGALVQQIEQHRAAGVRYFVLDAPAPVVAAVAQSTRGRDLLLFNVSAANDELRQQQCQPHLLHTIPGRAMQTDALAQYLVSKKWRNVLLLAGPQPADRQLAQAFEGSARKFGLRITQRRDFLLSNDPRERERGNVALLTAGADYDVVFVADEDGEFARSVPYRTLRPRPVVGAEGLAAVAWHWNWERHGAPQLNRRLERHAARALGDADWAAWIAVKAVVESVVRSGNGSPSEVFAYLRSEELILDGFKGMRLNFRPWDNQLRQPILLATHNAVIERAPLAGFLHQTNVLDTLGFDRRDSRCVGGAP